MCFTINTFAENEEGQLTYNSTEETMEIVIQEENKELRVSMIKYNAGDDDNPSYEWKINPNDDFFKYAIYNIFCNGV